MASLGILGGSFNPPHNGHIALARAAIECLGLDHVLLVPCGVPPHKTLSQDPGAELRFEMCQAACEGQPGISASRVEVDREGRSYTVDTLSHVLEAEPDTDVTLLLGADMALSLPSWQDPEKIVAMARIAWAGRSGAEREAVDQVVASLGSGRPVQSIAMDRVDVSSTMIRERVSAGESIHDLVPDAVEQLIIRDHLYRNQSQD